MTTMSRVRHTPLRVLVVEDDPLFRGAFEAACGEAPDLAIVGSAASLAEGRVQMARLADAPPDVLLTDLQLPDGSGIELIRAVRAAWPGCEAMVATVFGDESLVIAAIEAGAAGYLLKDSAPASFVEQIRLLAEGGSPISPLIARRLLARLRPAGAAPADGTGDAAARTADAETAATLSPREAEVLQAITKGFAFDEIATLLGLSRHTVQTHVRHIYAKLEVRSKTEAVYEARRLGLVRD
jgi:DNA-binding NarL/FixJ family response regulator